MIQDPSKELNRKLCIIPVCLYYVKADNKIYPCNKDQLISMLRAGYDSAKVIKVDTRYIDFYEYKNFLMVLESLCEAFETLTIGNICGRYMYIFDGESQIELETKSEDRSVRATILEGCLEILDYPYIESKLREKLININWI